MNQSIFGQQFSIIVVSVSMLLLISSLSISYAQNEGTSQETNVVRDSATILLEGKTLAGGDFIHLYDTTPYTIMNGHVAAKLPCDKNSESPVKILIGSAPNLRAADFELISELSTPGTACLYHVDLKSGQGGNASDIITDIAIQNPTGDQINFGPSNTVVIGVNEIMKIAHEAHAEGENGAEHSETNKNETSNK